MSDLPLGATYPHVARLRAEYGDNGLATAALLLRSTFGFQAVLRVLFDLRCNTDTIVALSLVGAAFGP